MTVALKKPREGMPDAKALQLKASDPASSIWVGASAGSGKTTVLVKRVLRLLLAGVEPQKILCITFTRAAAAEMAIRVTQQLAQWTTCDDDELSASLGELQGRAPKPDQLIEARRLFARMLACPGGMRIRTIHAFCQEILRRFPVEADLPPHFTVIEETDARALQEDAQASLLRMAAQEPSGALGKALGLLAGDFGEYGFDEAMQAVLNSRARIAQAIAEAGNLEQLDVRIHAFFDLAPGDSEESFIHKAVDDRVLPREDMRRAAEALKQGLPSCQKQGEKILSWLRLPPGERAALFDTYIECFFTSEGDIRKKLSDKKTQAAFPDADAILQREAARLQDARERIEAARMAEETSAILALGTELMRRYEARKSAQALLDYDDLVIRAGGLLRLSGIAPWVLFKLDGGLDHILVDEAQDTSRAQWSIIAALAEEFFSGLGARADRNRTLFVVGDEKQSVFSFQHADPEAFEEMRRFFGRRIEDAAKAYGEVPLHMSFRSAPAVLRAVDAVFAGDRARSGVSPEPVRHYAARDGKIGQVEVWPLIPAPEKEERTNEWTLPLDYEPDRDPQTELASLIAARIKSWLDAKEKLPGYARPIAPGDIMILLRRRGDFAARMVRALKKAGVPVTGVDRMKLVKQLAVMDLLALAQFTLLPEDDLNLATVLRGPLLGLNEEQLMELAIGRKGTLWQSLKEKADGNAAYAAARDYLQKWFDKADFITPFALFAHVLNEACPGGAVSGRQALWARLGPDALDPIDELLNAAQEFGRRHAPSLQGFLHWLTSAGAEIKRELDRGGGPHGSGQVRIMTVHAAKGLEAPIVFLPDTANVPGAREMPRLLWSADGLPLYIRRKPQSGAARQAWDRAREKQLEEYRRLFYVALTRAANRITIGGWAGKRSEGENFEESWYALARSALAPLHEAIIEEKNGPVPDIFFADHDLPPAEKESAPEKLSARAVKLPNWARRPALAEPAAAKPLAPSRLVAEAEPPAAAPDKLYARGRIIHRLLQSLPDIEDARREDIAARFLANPQHRLSEREQKEIAAEVLNLLRHPGYAPLFDADSRAEVALSGRIGGHPVSGQIDRLCVRRDGVWIVDYKSNRPPPEKAEDVSIAYRKQLAAYRTVLSDIYPGKTIRCFLLWTYGPQLMPIPDTLLDNA